MCEVTGVQTGSEQVHTGPRPPPPLSLWLAAHLAQVMHGEGAV